MPFQFTNKVVVITGASEGIGRELSHQLAKAGAKLAISARNKERLESLKQELSQYYANVDEYVLVKDADVCDQVACQSLISATIDKFSHLDILVNNAGMSMWSKFEDLQDLSIFNNLYQLNVTSVAYCTHAALPHLKQSKGMIVGVASVAGITGVPTRTAYSASKHALIGFLDSLRIELQPHDIDVVCVAPDFVISEIHKRALDGSGQPLGQSPMQQSKIMTTKRCCELIVQAMKHKQRLAVLSTRGKIGRWLKLLWPSLIDKLALKAIQDKH